MNNLKRTTVTALIAAALMLTAAALFGAQPTAQPSIADDSPYSAREFSMDLGAQYDVNASSSLLDTQLDGGDFAFSLGVNYYFTRNFGAGADFYCLEPGAQQEADEGPGSTPLIKSANISLLARLPVGRFAPYAIGGGGRNWHDNVYTAHAGAGLECRISNGLGIFTEARHVWVLDKNSSAPDELQFRAGIRVAKW